MTGFQCPIRPIPSCLGEGPLRGTKPEAPDVSAGLPLSADSGHPPGHYRAAGVDPNRPLNLMAETALRGDEVDR